MVRHRKEEPGYEETEILIWIRSQGGKTPKAKIEAGNRENDSIEVINIIGIVFYLNE